MDIDKLQDAKKVLERMLKDQKILLRGDWQIKDGEQDALQTALQAIEIVEKLPSKEEIANIIRQKAYAEIGGLGRVGLSNYEDLVTAISDRINGKEGK